MPSIYEFNLSEKQAKQFEIYYEMLIEYNEKCNLTAITEKEDVYLKHFYDSLLFTKVQPLTNESILDVGSGAGFPSIPLKIMYPEIKVTIVDALNKRINFLKELCEKLDVEATLVHARAEDYIEENRESFDIVTARAVARLNILAELCIPFVKLNGHFIVLKGMQGLEEVEEAKNATKILGTKLIKSLEYELPSDKGKRYLLKYEKVNATPKKYPRSFSQIKSKPL